jgi:hypothetical protein
MAATLIANDPRAAFDGVWRTVEVTVPGPTPQTFRPTATLAIFHGRHYSRVEVHTDQEPFEVDGNTITMEAIVAKNPVAMNGARSIYTFQRTGDTMTLTQVRSPKSARAIPVVIRLARVE